MREGDSVHAAAEEVGVTIGMGRPLAGLCSFLRGVQIPEQAALFGQSIHTGEKALHACKGLFAFDGDEFVFPFLPRLMPTL